MTTILHNEFDYDTSNLKRAIKLGEAKPTARKHSQMTIFPLGLPQETRDRIASLSFLTGESQAEIIRQAMSRILEAGPEGVIRTSEMRTQERTAVRAGEAAVRAERAARRAQARELVSQEKAAAAAQKAVVKAKKAATVPVPTQPEAPPQTEQPMDQGVEAVTDNLPELPAQLDRPLPPSPAHIWVRGAANRWGGYWRAPKGQRTV